MKIKYDHKPPQRLYMKIFVGYFLLIGLVLTAAALVYIEYRNIECAVQEEEQTAERWKQANRTFETMFDLAMFELHTFTADKEGYEEYERKNLAAQQMLDSLKRLYPEEKQLERIDSAKSILAEKSLQVLCLMGTFKDLAHTDSLIECQIREMTLVEQKAIRELKKDSEQKKGSWIGRLFKKKNRKQEPVEQAAESRTQAVGRLTKLREEISERNESLRSRMEMQTDSLRLRNEYLNKNFARLMHEFQQASTEQRVAEMEEMLSMRRHSFSYIAGLTLFGMLLSFVLYSIIHRDIRRRYRERLKLIVLNEEKQEMLEQKERCMMTMSHELRSPLSAVMGYAELLPDISCEGEVNQIKQNIQQAGERMQSLLNTLLSYYRLTAGKVRVNPVLFSPQSIERTLGGLFSVAAEEKGLSLHTEYVGDGLAVVSGDRERILQIGQNLLSNAIKFTDEGCVTLSVRFEDGMMTMEVGDTGPGMTDEEKKRAFEPFARLANADVQEGFGLGLNITKELTEMLGGQLEVDSKKGEGTTFRITLPLPSASGIKEDIPELRTTDLPKNLRVIAVDDDKVILNLIQQQMEYAGVHCDICRNPSEMVERLREGHYDLLLTDIRMPGMNGYELLELLRNSNVGNSKEVPVLVITAHVPRKKEELMEAGFDGCLYKPFAREELYAAVNAALERGKERNGHEEETDEIDFSPLLVKEEDGKEMLHILRKQTQRDMEVLADIVRRQDMDALTDMVHHLLPVWTMLRIDDCLLELRRIYKREDAEWTEIEKVTDKIQVQGKRLAELAGRKEEAYGEEPTSSRE
ncbi:His Kinase A (phospho-acceptor) domain-containing protein [Bacteroides faecichinchillae]|uniref:histidine kinase n=3 Tax=Bacteroides faecichinchillae TaxID=871325 RepID=A0A1M5B5K6_9BACE|nr:His Kinase A (phospho-acceptor) domain-containing protein [Bacteroides faecichinchillae]